MNETIQIQLSLRDFLQLILGDKEFKEVPNYIGMLVNAIDMDKKICHVQFSDFDGKVLPRPKIWWIKEWKIKDKVIAENKAKHEEQRRIALKQSDNIIKLGNVLQRKFHLDIKTSRNMAIEMVLKGKGDLLRILGAKVEDLTDEEKKLLGEVTYL